jgi:hypothetical protein
MIYILTGVAKAGKTLVSNEILKRHNISVFSTDYIMMMLAKGNKDLNIDTYASDSTVARMIEPYVYGMIETMVENNAIHVIEGVHFNTDFSRRMIDEFGDKVKILYLGYKDVTAKYKIDELYKYRDEMNNPWIFNHPGESVEDIVKYLINESKRIHNECLSLGLTYIEVYNINIQLDGIIQTFLNYYK